MEGLTDIVYPLLYQLKFLYGKERKINNSFYIEIYFFLPIAFN